MLRDVGNPARFSPYRNMPGCMYACRLSTREAIPRSLPLGPYVAADWLHSRSAMLVQADIVNDVVMAETGRRWLRSKALLLMAVLLLMVTVSVYGTTWTVIRSLHSRVDHLSDHISAASVRPAATSVSLAGELLQRGAFIGSLFVRAVRQSEHSECSNSPGDVQVS